MEFAFTEEQAMIGETARAFFTENATSERTRKAMSELRLEMGEQLGLRKKDEFMELLKRM